MIIHNEKYFAIVSASSNKTFMWMEDVRRLNRSSTTFTGCNITFEDNERSLTSVYNEALDEIRNDKHVDYAIFLHSDVRINDLRFFDKIAESRFDLIGVAGSTAIDMRVTPLSWFNAAKDNRDRRGVIIHGYDDGALCANAYAPGQNLSSKCLCIDGVCMVMNRKAIDSGLRFDEQFTYDFYDMDLSFEATLNHKLSVGVEPLLMTHYSIGEGILRGSYKDAEKLFRAKWEPRLKH